MNNMLLTKSQTWLTELGIRSELSGTCLKVNRDDVINFVGGDETFANKEMLNGLKDAISSKLFWGGKDDNWLFLESF